jgi:two-component system chemotaxis sensor kinase CheA
MAYDPVPTFLLEVEELIADIEQSALGLSSEGDPAENVNRLFRAFHTIKGSSGMCGFDAVAGFTHHVESLLDQVRNGAIPVSGPLADLVLRAVDHIKMLLGAAQGGECPSTASGEALVAVIAEFGTSSERTSSQRTSSERTSSERTSSERTSAQRISHEQTSSERSAAERTSSERTSSEETSPERSWTIRFRPDPTLLASGGNPVALFRDLRTLGTCKITAHSDEVPALDVIQPDRCYLWWTITLGTSADKNAIRDVFLFVEDGSTLEIECLDLPTAAPEKLPTEAPPQRKAIAKEATVRVPAERLDRLVNLVGEFVMNQSCLAQAATQNGAAALANPVQVLERLVAELRDNVLGIRMLPIDTLFGRFRRLIHDLSAELGKEADLVTEGGETELDKSILDQLGDPLVHCLRNCLDHGIEPAAERAAKGKARRATVRLSAAHTGSSVVIAIEDDGRGIDREAVRAKAVEKQLAPPNASLSDREILNLILLPGFSTAREVTSVSGRGVGMDAVKRQIDLLRGSLSLESKEGRGTRVSITLPLTLAIIDGLLVEVGGDPFILPMTAVAENVELNQSERARNNGRNLLAVRGKLVPYIDLREAFQIAGETPGIEKVVIVQHADERVGLVVERVLGTHQTVIQSLGKFYKNVEVVSGATIMGDGRVALILDVARLIHFRDKSEQHS